MRPAKTQISLGIRPVWSESSPSAWRNLGSLTTRWAHSEDSDQTGRMPRLIWVFVGRTLILLVLSCRGSDSLFCISNLHQSQINKDSIFCPWIRRNAFPHKTRILGGNHDFLTSSNYDRKTENTSSLFEKTFCCIYFLYNTLYVLYSICVELSCSSRIWLKNMTGLF